MNKNILKNIIEKINKDESLSPCLFLGGQNELLSAQVLEIAHELTKEFQIPKNFVYTLKDTWEKIKISEIKDFIQTGYSHPGHKFQIFIIENISRLTIQSSNSCLKFFEEPWKHNIIFLTNSSESWVLDTILSRVQNIDMWWRKQKIENPYFQSLLNQISQWEKQEALQYFYWLKWEKEEYIEFLENIILFAKKHLKFLHILEEVESDILGIKQNNVNAKYVIDKYLLTL